MNLFADLANDPFFSCMNPMLGFGFPQQQQQQRNSANDQPANQYQQQQQQQQPPPQQQSYQQYQQYQPPPPPPPPPTDGNANPNPNPNPNPNGNAYQNPYQNPNFNMLADTFAMMQNLMTGMGQTFEQMQASMNNKDFDSANFPGVQFATTKVTSLSRQNGGKPKVMQSSSEQVRGPEGLERTRKTVRDTERNLDKVEVAHRLGNRGLKVVQERDPATGQLRENREAEQVEDEGQFEREWLDRAGQLGFPNQNGADSDSDSNASGIAGPYQSRAPHPTQSSFAPKPTYRAGSGRTDYRRDTRKN